MKTLYLSIFIITLLLLAYLLTDEKNLKIMNIFQILSYKKKYY